MLMHLSITVHNVKGGFWRSPSLLEYQSSKSVSVTAVQCASEVIWRSLVGRQAREDALLLLVACARSYGAAALKPYLTQIWGGLRPILTAGINDSCGPEDKAEVWLVRSPCDVSSQAVQRRCVTALPQSDEQLARHGAPARHTWLQSFEMLGEPAGRPSLRQIDVCGCDRQRD